MKGHRKSAHQTLDITVTKPTTWFFKLLSRCMGGMQESLAIQIREAQGCRSFTEWARLVGVWKARGLTEMSARKNAMGLQMAGRSTGIGRKVISVIPAKNLPVSSYVLTSA